MNKQNPVFVVGTPRSGTSLLTAMLSSHGRIGAGPETQFFSKLPLKDLDTAVRSPSWPYEAARLISSLTLAGQSVTDTYGTTSAEIAEFLSTSPPGISSMLESLTVPFARKQGKQRWAEKTPNHILSLPTIRSLWPGAPVIRILRDPRDVAMSMRRIHGQSQSILANLYLWLEWVEASEDFCEDDVLCKTVYYEGLMADPESVLRGVCDFIGEDFDSKMMEFQASAGLVSSPGEVWKAQLNEGLDRGRVHAWRKTLSPEIAHAANLLCYDSLQRHGYPFSPEEFGVKTAFRMSRSYVEENEAKLIEEFAKGVCWRPAPNPWRANRIVDQPQYRRFRNPIHIARLAFARAADHRSRSRSNGPGQVDH